MAVRAPFRKAALGTALHDESGHISYVADFFYHRVEELAGEHHVPPRLILGHIAAHEIEHLLLGPLGHSRKGIMQAPWGKNDLKHSSRGELLFTPKQGERIRAEVLARTMKQDSLQLARSKVPSQRTPAKEEKGPVQRGERGKPVVASIPR